jgi:hypothetical protein
LAFIATSLKTLVINKDDAGIRRRSKFTFPVFSFQYILHENLSDAESILEEIRSGGSAGPASDDLGRDVEHSVPSVVAGWRLGAPSPTPSVVGTLWSVVGNGCPPSSARPVSAIKSSMNGTLRRPKTSHRPFVRAVPVIVTERDG